MKTIIAIISAIVTILTSIVVALGSMFIEIGGVASVVISILKLCGIVKVAWLTAWLPFLIPLGGIVIGGILLVLCLVIVALLGGDVKSIKKRK